MKNCLLSLSILLLSMAASVVSQEEQTAAPLQLERLTKAVDTQDGLSEEARAALIEALGDIEDTLARDREFKSQSASFEQMMEGGADEVKTLQEELEQLQEVSPTLSAALLNSADLGMLEAEIDRLDTQRGAWTRERRQELDASANASRVDTQRRTRLSEIAGELQETYSVVPEEGSPALSQQIEALSAQVKRNALLSEEAMLQLALRAAPQVNALRAVRIAWLDASIDQADVLIDELRDLIASQRGDEAQRRLDEVEKILAPLGDSIPEPIALLAADNRRAIDAYRKLAIQIETTRNTINRLRSGAEQVNEDASLTRRRLEVAGLEAELGDVMLSRLSSLPDTASLAEGRRDRNSLIATMSLDAIDTEQSLRSLDSPQSRSATTGDLVRGERQALGALRTQRRELLQTTLESQNRLLVLLVEANQESTGLESFTDSYRELLTANLLWVRNYEALNPRTLRSQLSLISKSARDWLADGLRPQRLLTPVFLLSVLVVLFLAVRRRAGVLYLETLLGQPIRPRDERSVVVLKALAVECLVVLPWPLMLFLIADAALRMAPGDPFAFGIHQTLMALGVVVGLMGFVDRMGGRLGTGRRLLKWNGSKVDALTRDLPWGRLTIATATAFFVLGHSMTPALVGGTLAVTGSAIATVALFLIVLRMHGSGAFSADRFAKIGLRVTGIVLAAIALMHVGGQVFAAHQYLWATVNSIVAVLVVLLVASVLQRILLIQRAALERKVKALKAREDDDSSADSSSDPDDDLDVATSLSEAYERLLALFRFLGLGVLLWYVWSPALPALAFLDSVTLWTSLDASADEATTRAITLSVLFLALLILGVALLLTKHLPPLINVLLIEWTSVSGGSRYATGMITQYIILGAGLSASLSMLGFQWSQVQWLVAALGVGIGFGLQEIVANFISGLIVLFERPIRVGDIINAGGHDGTVTEINARATVLQTFERKEVMIPNKELITSVVTNWSLSNTQLRVLIPIGIAYGSDVRQAIHLLLEAARKNPDTLDDPEPLVTFEDFGDNALILWLRCYASEDYIKVATDLRITIYETFNDAGIGIAFPQQDVHLDAQSPIPVRLLREDEDDRRGDS